MSDLRIITADVLDGLAMLDDESVQCVVTSPPYWGLRDYGVEGQLGLESTPEEYVEKMVAVFREVRRVLRADGTLWLNMGDCYASGGAIGQQRVAGRPELPNAPSGWGKREEWGTVPTAVSGLKPKDLIGQPWRLAFALQADGWWLRSDIIWAKPNPMPESVTDRPTKAHEYIFLMTKAARYFYDADAVREDGARYQWNTQKFKGGDITRHPGSTCGSEIADTSIGRNLRTVWTIPTQPYPEAHFATFPTALPERCIRAGSRPGDTVLDPFAGSGTTLMVARGLGRTAIGIELNPEYVELIERRCALPWEHDTSTEEQRSLFDPEAE